MNSWPALLSPFLTFVLSCTLGAMLSAWIWLVIRLRDGRPLLASTTPRTVPWGWRTVGAAVLAWIAVNVVVAVGYRQLTHRPRGISLGVTEQMFLVTVVNGLLLIVLPLIVHALSGARAADLGLGRSALTRQARVGTLAFLIVTWPVNLLNVLCTVVWPMHQKHPLEEMVRSGLNVDIVSLALLSAVVFAPAVEELLFRGIVQSWLTNVFQRSVDAAHAIEDPECATETSFAEVADHARLRSSHWAEWMAIVVTSAIFALLHSAQWPAPIAIFVLSLVLGFVYQRSGSLFASFVVHALFNGFSTLILFWAILHGAEQPAKGVPAPPSRVARRVGSAPGAVCPPVHKWYRENSVIGMFF